MSAWIRKLILRWFINAFPGDATKGRYGKMVKKIWDFVNGKKTAIGLLLVFLGDCLEKLPGILEAFGVDSVVVGNVAKALGWLITALGSIHKILK